MPPEKPDIWSVSQLTRRVKDLLETQVNRVWVAGEISNWRVSPAGHAYFTLKDEGSQVDVVMFRGRISRLQFEPDRGLEVVLFGQVTVYEKRGNYQIICDEMHPKGLGALQLAFEKLKAKLAEEGLFSEEHKKPLPLLPRRIGIVTSPTGAAVRDILNVIERRFANVHVLLYPARVQGEEASPEIVAGIRALEAFGVDVMIVGRGGGSLEDLWPFNEEAVVRAVFEAKTPIISAVGHEIDFALTDFAADLRAPTPSAAAELVVQERAALVDRLCRDRQRLGKALQRQARDARHRLELARSSYVLRNPEELLRERRQQVDDLRMRMEQEITEQATASRARLDGQIRALGLLSPSQQIARALERLTVLQARLGRSGAGAVERMRARFRPLIAQLDALSPLAILSRGYALARKLPERELVREARQLSAADELLLQFGAGSAVAVVKQVDEEANG
jgi:exodeoxyribonuclease VII large subunit